MLPVFHYRRAMLAVVRVSKPSQNRKLLATPERETKTFFLLNATKEKLHLNTQIKLFAWAEIKYADISDSVIGKRR